MEKRKIVYWGLVVLGLSGFILFVAGWLLGILGSMMS